MPKIEITIEPDGSTSIKVNGVKGKGCEALTKDLEEALGKVAERKHTNEYRERPQNTRLQQRGG